MVFPTKYRRSLKTEEIGLYLKGVYCRISECHEVQFVEVGYEPDHVHLLIRSVHSMLVSELVRKIKNITEKQLFPISRDQGKVVEREFLDKRLPS